MSAKSAIQNLLVELIYLRMGQYTCLKCGKTVEDIDKIVCPYCSGRILVKTRTSEVRELKAE